jgi:VanZ family protein
MAVIFGASSRSDVGAFGRVPDWITHGAAYLVLCALLCRALAGGLGRPLSVLAALSAVGLATAYGVSDELHQSLVPGREASLADVLKDLGGALAGSLLYGRFLGGRHE